MLGGGVSHPIWSCWDTHEPHAQDMGVSLRWCRGSSKKRFFLAKGVSAASSFTPKEAKWPQNIGPSNTFGTQSATARRGVYFCKNPLLKTPFSWFLMRSETHPGINYIDPRPSPMVGQKALWGGRGGRCLFWTPLPCSRNFMPPPLFIHPPPLEGSLQVGGGGGGGVSNLAL